MRITIFISVLFSTLLIVQNASAHTRVGISVNLSPYERYSVYDSHRRYSAFNQPRVYVGLGHSRYWNNYRDDYDRHHHNHRHHHNDRCGHRGYRGQHKGHRDYSGRIPRFNDHHR